MSEPEYVQPFRRSLLGVPEALNAYRQEHGRPPVEMSRILNFNASDRARHLLVAGLQDDAPFIETVRAFPGQDVSEAVELVRQWPSTKDDPAGYLLPWTKEQAAQAVLLGNYWYVGIAGDIVALKANKAPFMRIVVVMVLTKQQPRR